MGTKDNHRQFNLTTANPHSPCHVSACFGYHLRSGGELKPNLWNMSEWGPGRGYVTAQLKGETLVGHKPNSDVLAEEAHGAKNLA